mmetsp:Transcript_15431/g.31259  ORF Transcript_15431/g.31259 Transcript_15431/m.31259 type:complete len:97 (+) Transcript_15431:325-615(+)
MSVKNRELSRAPIGSSFISRSPASSPSGKRVRENWRTLKPVKFPLGGAFSRKHEKKRVCGVRDFDRYEEGTARGNSIHSEGNQIWQNYFQSYRRTA